jgi:hypothetical protein
MFAMFQKVVFVAYIQNSAKSEQETEIVSIMYNNVSWGNFFNKRSSTIKNGSG